MPYCPHCGKETPEGVYCTSCGSSLTPDSERVLIKAADANQKTVKFYAKWRNSCEAICIAVIFFFLALFFLRKFDDKLLSYGGYKALYRLAQAEQYKSLALIVGIIAGIIAFYFGVRCSQIEKNRIAVFNNRVVFCCSVEGFQVRELEVNYSDIIHVSLCSSYRAQDESVILSTTSGTFTVPVNDAPAICQAIREQMETMKQAEPS